MKTYIPINLGFGANDIKSLVNNFQSISTSIISLATAININRSRIKSLEDAVIPTFTTTGRPTSTPTKVYICINTTTNKINHTRDGGVTWYNADGTGA